MPQPAVDLGCDFGGDALESSPAVRGRGTARRAVEGAFLPTLVLPPHPKFQWCRPLHHAAHGPPHPFSRGRTREAMTDLRRGCLPFLNRSESAENPSMARRVVDVLVPVALDRAYSYCVPPALELAPG